MTRQASFGPFSISIPPVSGSPYRVVVRRLQAIYAIKHKLASRYERKRNIYLVLETSLRFKPLRPWVVRWWSHGPNIVYLVVKKVSTVMKK